MMHLMYSFKVLVVTRTLYSKLNLIWHYFFDLVIDKKNIVLVILVTMLLYDGINQGENNICPEDKVLFFKVK